ncbi:MAG: M23 family metallopeptidase [Bacilli bacterium]|nr:M23 family metallopeptidase [Bacilli bacterium]
MDTFEEEKRRIKKRRENYTNIKKDNQKNESKKYVTLLITRILIAIILFFGLIIFANTTKIGNKFVKEIMLKDNMSFSKIANVYDRYFGNIVPFEDLMKNDTTVFNEKMTYENIANYKEGYELTVKENYLVPTINSGIVVFIGEKEGFGNTIIIQGIDEIDYWYSNIDNSTVALYDYVEKGEYLGTSKGNKLYLTFKKGTEYLDYDEVLE